MKKLWICLMAALIVFSAVSCASTAEPIGEHHHGHCIEARENHCCRTGCR